MPALVKARASEADRPEPAPTMRAECRSFHINFVITDKFKHFFLLLSCQTLIHFISYSPLEKLSMRELVNLRYDGELIRSQDGMDAYDVAEAIYGFSDFSWHFPNNIWSEIEVRPILRGVREGSIDLPFVVEFVGVTATNIFFWGTSA